jgi:excinuclease UvrABC nuclease subunit
MGEITDRDRVAELVELYWREERNRENPFAIITIPNIEDREGLGSKIGCYVIYAADGKHRYIGMSQSNILKRLNTHMSKSVRECDFWTSAPAHSVDVIPVGEPWEAASLEAYLIEKLSPPEDGLKQRQDKETL